MESNKEGVAKIRKRIIKMAAKIYAASVLKSAMNSGADSDLFQGDEAEYMQQELERIADRIIYQTEVTSLDEAIEIAINSQSK